MKSTKVKVLRDKCISCGSCASIASGVFKLDDDGISTVVAQDGDTEEKKMMAAQGCPTGAIIVEDSETGEQLWPKD